MSMQFELQLVNEISNWLFFVLFPLLITARLRKESLKKTLHEIGIKRFDKKTGLKKRMDLMTVANPFSFL